MPGVGYSDALGRPHQSLEETQAGSHHEDENDAPEAKG